METGSWTAERTYSEVRGLARGVAVLRAMNRSPGGLASTTDVARACNLHRTTAKRLLETLRSEGLVCRGERDGLYRLTFGVRQLSEGFEDEAWVTKVASPLMRAAVGELMWPCDLCTAVAGEMVVRESTHRWSMLSQHRAMVGTRMPIMTTAVGRAFLAACDARQLQAMTSMLGKRDDKVGELARDRSYVARIVAQTRRRGHAINEGEMAGDTDFAAVAVPLYADGRLVGAMNVVFPKGACSQREATRRFVPPLRQLAQSIGKASAEFFC